MKAYEIIIILDPALTEEEVEGQINEIKEQVVKGNGEVQEIQRWGKRRLAYLVKKRREGYYVFLRLAIDPKTLASLEKNFTKEKFANWIRKEKSKIVKNKDEAIILKIAAKYSVPIAVIKSFLIYL